MRIDILTLFPEMFSSVLGSSILHRAASDVADPATGEIRPPVVSYHLTNIRDFTHDKHGKVDKAPYGGGPGMVLQCQPVWDAVVATEAQQPDVPARRILLTPEGQPFTQTVAHELAELPRLLLIAGHYEGFDQRVVDKLGPMKISLGDFVLTGGEIAAMAVIDAVVRLLPGVLGDDTSTDHESFAPGHQGILDYPHYTRPPEWQGMKVPDILLSGDHAKIEAWRQEQAIKQTREHRPDLLSEG